MKDIFNAIKDWIIRKLDKPAKSMSQVEMITYLQLELTKSNKRYDDLITYYLESTSTSHVANEEVKIEDLKPIGGYQKPWILRKQELERKDLEDFNTRVKKANEERLANAIKPTPEVAQNISDLEKELGVEP